MAPNRMLLAACALACAAPALVLPAAADGPRLDVLLWTETLHDSDGYEARNLDGTYYLWDPIGIRYQPVLDWDGRPSGPVRFEVHRETALALERSESCPAVRCGAPDAAGGDYARAGAGGGLDVYNATDASLLGPHEIRYAVRAYSGGSLIAEASSSIGVLVVGYEPRYDQYPYPLLSDDRRTSYENRAAVALRYMGSEGGGPGDSAGLHGERRSKINGFVYAGAAYDPWRPVWLNETLSWSEAIDGGSGACQARADGTMMVERAGYCKVYFEYPVLDTVVGPAGPRYENVTLFNTLASYGFAGRDVTYLSHYEYRFSEALFHAPLVVESLDADGQRSNASIRVEVAPADGAQLIREYVHEKVLYDTGDARLADVVAGDVYKAQYSVSGSGSVDVKLRRVAAEFKEYGANGQDLYGLDIIRLAPAYLGNSELARLLVPLDVGLGSLSPVVITAHVGNVTRQYVHIYVDFGTEHRIIANAAHDNKLLVEKRGGKVYIEPPEDFGNIVVLHVNGSMSDVACGFGCAISTLPTGSTHILGYNVWGGQAHAVVEVLEGNVGATPEDVSTENLVVLAMFLLFLPLLYWAYSRIRNRSA